LYKICYFEICLYCRSAKMSHSHVYDLTHLHHFFVVRTLEIYLLSNCQEHFAVLLTPVTMFNCCLELTPVSWNFMSFHLQMLISFPQPLGEAPFPSMSVSSALPDSACKRD
jgi:hypothetical protein